MKTSYYNLRTDIEDNTLVFNTISKSFVCFSRRRFDVINHKGNFIIEQLSDDEVLTLLENGFIIENNDLDERQIWLDLRQQRRLKNDTYMMIINPTLDCNLKCWYCFQNHKKGSHITDRLIEAIKNNIEYQYELVRYKTLFLSFFGGEPMIEYKQIIKIIELSRFFCERKNINMKVFFTTNGTIVNPDLLDVIRNLKSGFQITIDGDSIMHNQTRVYKNNVQVPTFPIITKNIRRLQDLLPLTNINIRCNYSSSTLENMDELFLFLKTLDPKRTRISLHKVWQIDEKTIDLDLLLRKVIDIKSMGFNVSVQSLPIRDDLCYADYGNSLVINYNGDVFKCTSRDFSKEQRCGMLNDCGIVQWNYEKFQSHCFSKIPPQCENCKYLPCCPSFCSQSMNEGNTKSCQLHQNATLEDMVLLNYFLRK